MSRHLLACFRRYRQRFTCCRLSRAWNWLCRCRSGCRLDCYDYGLRCGGISGGHFNPAVTLGLTISGRFAAKDLIPYWIAQLIGGIIAAALLYLIASGKDGFTAGNFASNGYGELSPGHYNLTSAFIIEGVMTAFFLIIILGSTSAQAPAKLAPIAIGLGLTVIHLASIPVTNTSLNPARSTATALFAESAALSQLWLFWIAPLIGAALGAVIWKSLLGKD